MTTSAPSQIHASGGREGPESGKLRRDGSHGVGEERRGRRRRGFCRLHHSRAERNRTGAEGEGGACTPSARVRQEHGGRSGGPKPVGTGSSDNSTGRRGRTHWQRLVRDGGGGCWRRRPEGRVRKQSTSIRGQTRRQQRRQRHRARRESRRRKRRRRASLRLRKGARAPRRARNSRSSERPIHEMCLKGGQRLNTQWQSAAGRKRLKRG